VDAPLTVDAVEGGPLAGADRAAKERDAWKRFSLLLLDACLRHCLHWPPEENPAFQQRLQEAAGQLRDGPTASEVLIAAGALTQAIEHHSRRSRSQFEAAVLRFSSCRRQDHRTDNP
jgi:hypothetical protein